MGFLERFFGRQDVNRPTSSFEGCSEEELGAHLDVSQYGDFELSDAIRPSYDLQVVPRNGYRHDEYFDEENNKKVPVIMASATRKKLLQLFMDLLDPLGRKVDVILETSHEESSGNNHDNLYREVIDLPVLKSLLLKYEDLLTNDGCTGIVVLNPRIPAEAQFDEHKLIVVYGQQLETYEKIISTVAPRDESIKFVTEAEHVHSSTDIFREQFCDFARDLGLDNYSGGRISFDSLFMDDDRKGGGEEWKNGGEIDLGESM